MTPIIRRTLHWAGSGVALIGIIFVAMRLKEYGGKQDFSCITMLMWIAISGLAVIYGTANILMALAWRRLLFHFKMRVTRHWAIKTYGISQLAKYVPGNIFHLAGRQAIGMSAGVSGSALAKSTLWELGLLAVAGALYGWLILPIFISIVSPIMSVILLLMTIVLMAYLARIIMDGQVAACLLLQILFLSISASVFTLLFLLNNHGPSFPLHTLLLIAGGYIIAWLIGLVTPGAPAGVGVRELVLLFLLKNLVAEADLLMTVLLGRIITVAGDVLFFGGAFLMKNKKVFMTR